MRILYAALVFGAGEIVSLFVFARLKTAMDRPNAGSGSRVSVMKGVLERAVLLVGLLYGFSQILIAFGALKIGTRLHADQKSEISNNYFLVGNLVSILLAMLYAIVTRRLWNT